MLPFSAADYVYALLKIVTCQNYQSSFVFVIVIKGATSRYFKLFLPSTKLPLNSRKPENNTLQRQKNTKEIIINHKGTRIVKDGED